MSQTSLSTYLGYQVYANNLPASLQRTAQEGANATAKAYYDANIDKVTSVDDFIGNYKLFSYAMQSAGLSDMTYAKAFMKQVLQSNLSDSDSFVNKLTDPRFKAFAEQFSLASSSTPAAHFFFNDKGTISLYTAKTGSNSVSGLLATAYYEEHIGDVKSVKDLTNDSQLLNYVMTAYGLDASKIDTGSYSDYLNGQSQLASVLESDSSDPNSTAAQMAAGTTDASDIPIAVQSASQQDTVSTLYTQAYGRTNDLIYYENTIGSVHSIDGFLADPKLVTVAEKAYGLDPSSYSTTDLKRILTSDLDDPMSVANQLGPDAIGFAKAFNVSTSSSSTNPYLAISQDFNFDRNGNAATTRVAQSTVNIAGTETLYTAQAKSGKASQAAATTETSYYTSTIGSVTTLDGLLSNARLTSYVKAAYGLPANTTTDTLRQILTSDITDPKSVANTMGAGTRQLAAAFNFSTSGTITRSTGGAQSAKAAQITDDNYMEQSLENEAGQSNQGVELALYFRRKVASGAVSSAYSILADSALLKVVQTALSIPTTASKEDIDLQASQITNRLNLSSLKDPKALNKFISQFANLYDLANNQSSGSDTIFALFGSG